ncbi:MAG: 3-hydroxybutyryl-CoA dehydrogenase [Candidatus Zixiibacteriota bacterium]
MTPSDHIRKVGVIGAGTMGGGIAHVFAQHGFSVVLVDSVDGALQNARATISGNLDRQIKKQVIPAGDKDAILGRITATLDLKATAGCQLIIEAISENLDAKLRLIGSLNGWCGDDTIVATNSSSLPITRLAAAAKHPDRFIGMHFMNPVPVMKLVEIIRGHQTSESTYEIVVDLCGRLGKTGVGVNDYPGFVSNRILMPMLNEAMYCVMEGVAEPAAIDEVMKLGMAHPMGPLALADFIGLDVCLAIMNVLYEGLGDSKYRACPLLRKMVYAGDLGRKTGRGFYSYAATA